MKEDKKNVIPESAFFDLLGSYDPVLSFLEPWEYVKVNGILIRRNPSGVLQSTVAEGCISDEYNEVTITELKKRELKKRELKKRE